MKYLNIRRSFVLIIVFYVMSCFLLFKYYVRDKRYNFVWDKRLLMHYNVVNSFFDKRKNWKTSNLGSILFKNVNVNNFKEQNRTFTIWLYKMWGYYYKRHNLLNYATNCSVKNCRFKANPTENFDATIVDVYFGGKPSHRIRKKRKPNHIWMMFFDESPRHWRLSKPVMNLTTLADEFNWTVTLRHDADIPIPAGRVVPLKRPIIPDFTMSDSTYYSSKFAENFLKKMVPHWKEKRRDVLITMMYSHCREERDEAVRVLEEQLEVHVYGKCSKDDVLERRCAGTEGGFYPYCPIAKDYLFYLVMENSKCFEYITEKSYYHGFTLGSIPIIMGPSLADCQLHLPPNSFIYVKNIEELSQIGDKLIKLAYNKPELLKYHEWRNHFKVENDHGCFSTQSKYFCRICEGLNYNSYVSILDLKKVESFLDPNINCDNSSWSLAKPYYLQGGLIQEEMFESTKI